MPAKTTEETELTEPQQGAGRDGKLSPRGSLSHCYGLDLRCPKGYVLNAWSSTSTGKESNL